MISFSVIVINFNNAPFLDQRLHSIITQTYPHFELIILDDCSTDESRKIIDAYRHEPKVSHLVYSSENSGSAYGNWEKAITLSQFEWIWIAESDDFADIHFLEACADMINECPEAALCYTDSYILNHETKAIAGTYAARRNKLFSTDKWTNDYCNDGVKEINQYLKYDCTINNVSAAVFKKHPALLFLKDLAEYKYYGDWYFFLNMCFCSGICYRASPFNTYRFHMDSHLNKKTPLPVSKKEYFQILKLLYYNESVTDKRKLINLFSYNYLAFGILETGLREKISIVKTYYRLDRKLALMIYLRIILIKLSPARYKRKYELYLPAETG
jgi:glycosyltransferase involved in cell wall biosynthesis